MISSKGLEPNGEKNHIVNKTSLQYAGGHTSRSGWLRYPVAIPATREWDGASRIEKYSGPAVVRVFLPTATDVLSPADLAKRHRAYHFRIMIGPSYRADMWAALESNPELSTAELARKTYGSFATAWRVKREFAVLASQTVRSAAVQKPRSA